MRAKRGHQKERKPRQRWVAVGPARKHQARGEGWMRRCDQRLRQTAEKRREGALMWVVNLKKFELEGEYNTGGGATSRYANRSGGLFRVSCPT